MVKDPSVNTVSWNATKHLIRILNARLKHANRDQCKKNKLNISFIKAKETNAIEIKLLIEGNK